MADHGPSRATITTRIANVFSRRLSESSGASKSLSETERRHWEENRPTMRPNGANIRSVEWKTPPPLRAGSKVAFIAHFLGRRIAYTYEFVEFVRGRLLVMRTAEGPFPMESTHGSRQVTARLG